LGRLKSAIQSAGFRTISARGLDAALVIGCAVLFVVAGIEDALTHSISGITRLAWFAWLLCSLPATALAIICLATGLVRRYFLKS